MRQNISQHEPWIKLKADSSSRLGNDRFEGFVMDLLDQLAAKTGARFEVENILTKIKLLRFVC